MRHWTDDELIDSVYGIGPADDHLESCAECRGRRARIEARRVEIAREAEPPAAILAAQRRAIYARAEQHAFRPGWMRAAAASAGVAALAVALMVFQPGTQTKRVDTAAVDPQLFAEALSAVSTEEPRAAQPIYALFEEAQ
jgi:hypothetical protein